MKNQLILSDDRKIIIDVEDTDFTSVVIPDSVTVIGHRAFEFCSWLQSIDIPKNVIEIGDFAFYGCRSLQSFNVDGDNPVFSSVEGVILKNKTILFLYPPGKESLCYSIPEGVTSIGEFAFEDCSNLQTVDIPESVTEIGMGAFTKCYNLQSVNIPCNISKIGPFAFGNTAIESITIPESVKEIGTEAFSDSKLKTIYMKSKNINEVYVEKDAFQYVSTDCILFVPKDVLDDYRCHPVFGLFKNIRIEE